MNNVVLSRDGLSLNGRPVFLLAAQLHYFRFPRAEWRSLLLAAKACGINTIDTVIAWNLHEPQPGVFYFEDYADLPHYLDLCQELGLYVIARPDPYICAEWENGGFPAWLTGQPGVELRVDHPTYVEATRRYFEQLMTILVPRQYSRGGPIVLVQIENEHWASGRYGHDGHQQSLVTLGEQFGIDVPRYTCMGAMPDQAEFRNGWTGIAEKLVQTRNLWPDNPMIVSELWSGWFDNWGASRHNQKTAARFDTILQQLLAVGASGYSHWVWAGGTNFGYWGGRTVGGDTIHMTTSYDYDAPVTEYGGLTEKAYVARRHHLFAATLGMPLSQVLANGQAGGPKVIAPAAIAGRGEAGSGPYRSIKAGPDAPAGWQHFSATFLNNPGQEGQVHQVFLSNPAVHLAVDIEAGTLKPIFNNMPLANTGVTLDYHTLRLLGLWSYPQADLLVIYGHEGEVGQLQLRTSGQWQVLDTGYADVTAAGHTLHIHTWIADRPTVIRAERDGRGFQIVVLSRARAERCWPVSDGVLIGPDLVVEDHGTWQATSAGLQPRYQVAADGTLAFAPATAAPRSNPSVIWGAGGQHLEWQALTPTQMQPDTDGWHTIPAPQSLESLGCDLGYGWYRARFTSPQATQINLAIPWVTDRARVILDGQDLGWVGIHPRSPVFVIPAHISAGQHELLLLVDNLGRFNYGSNTGEAKGLLDTIYLDGLQQDISDGWTGLWQEAVFAGEALANAKPEHVRADLANVHLGRLAFQGPSIWLLRSFEAQPGRNYLIRMTGDRNPGALFVNGVNVARFSRHHGGGYIKQDITHLLRPGRNYLSLNIQGYAGIAWQATLISFDQNQPLAANWSFQPFSLPENNTHPSEAANGPRFWSTQFQYDPQTHGHGPFKLAVPGLGKGQIWLNGRNIGRFWRVGPQEYYKLPASWFQPTNQLLIFDEEGSTPDHIHILVDQLGANHRPEH